VTRVLLASSSPRRTELLRRAGLEHTVVPPLEDVVPPPALPPEIAVQVIARAKAADVMGSAGATAFVIAADTVVVGPGGPLGKPHTEARAREMLTGLRGRRHMVLTAISLLTGDGREFLDVSRSEVTMKAFSDEQLEEYVAGGEPLDKAGGYGVQGAGAALIGSVSGRVDTVVGLDVALTFDLLRRAGYPDPLPAATDVTAGLGITDPSPAPRPF